jgi:hypothetical protein
MKISYPILSHMKDLIFRISKRIFFNYTFILVVCLCTITGNISDASAQKAKPRIKLGSYYFGGWGGKCPYDDGTPGNAWALGMPGRLTKLLATEYDGREPVWGWREDKPEIMKRQIDLAADNGISYFSFVWSTSDNLYNAYKKRKIDILTVEKVDVNQDINFFMDADNNNRMEFCLTIASTLTGDIDWSQTIDYWIAKYFKHPRYMKVDGKPVVMFFFSGKVDKKWLAYLQDAAKAAGFPGVLSTGCRACTTDDGYQAQTLYNTIPHNGLNNTDLYPFKILSDWNVSIWNSINIPDMPYIPCLTAGWDRSPWEPADGTGRVGGVSLSPHFARATPAEFESYIRELLWWMDNHPEKITKDRLAIIYAWNEIGEGGWLVPCKEDPAGEYLKAIRRVVFGK